MNQKTLILVKEYEFDAKSIYSCIIDFINEKKYHKT